ncbi:MAG: GntR family transcriptional regulator [Thermotaleaceae bacterium]
MKKVNKNSFVPLYYQLKDSITELIENEELKPREPIPSERELCEYHGVSRMTVNKAISGLVSEGLLYREQGKGTFVAFPKERHSLSALRSFTEDMKRQGLIVETKMISFQRKPVTKKIEKVLQLKKSEEVFEIRRLRIVSGEPYALETAYIPTYLCEDLSTEKLESGSLYSTLQEEYKIEIDYAYQTIEPVIIDEYERMLLKVEKGSLGLLFSRKTYSKDHTPIELTKAIYRSDKYKYEVMLKR